jgi:hypothetical protein
MENSTDLRPLLRTLWGEMMHQVERENKICKVRRDVYDHFLNCLPPIFMDRISFLSSEPFSHIMEGGLCVGTYIGCAMVNNDWCIFLATKKQFRDRAFLEYAYGDDFSGVDFQM